MVVRKALRFLLPLFAIASLSSAQSSGQSCAENAVPYKIVVDDTGRPELSCETPSCFGGEGSASVSHEKSDSKESRSNEIVCNHELLETVCVGEYEWTSGLVEVNNGTHRTLKTECCTYEGLTKSRELKTVLLEAGDRFEGGSVTVKGDDKAFDVIKEVRKTVNSENKVQYVISIYRMPCAGAKDAEKDDEFVPYSSNAFNRIKRRMGAEGRREGGGRRHREGRERESHDREGLYDDEYYEPVRRKHMRPAYDDYEFMPRMRRPFARRRAMMRRRPVVDYYDDYEVDYAPLPRPLFRRNRMRQMSALMQDDRLWPVFGPQAPAPLPGQRRQRVYAAEQTALPGNYYQELVPVSGGQQALPDSGASEVLPQAPEQLPVMENSAVDTRAPAPLAGSSYQTGPVAPPQGGSYVQPQYIAPPQNSYVQPPQYAQAPAQAACGYPTCQSGASLNSMFDRMQCFSGDMEVDTPEGKKFMRDLKTGDSVLSVEENFVNYSPIVMFLHRDHDQLADFNVIQTLSGHQLKLTDEHLIYVTDCTPISELKLVRSKEVTMDHCVQAFTTQKKTSLQASKVINITRVSEKGIYAPLTVTGDLVVNDVLASCHSNLAVKTLQQSFFTVYRSVSRTISSIFNSPSSLDHTELPPGVAYMTTVLDLFVPVKV